jgi:predicted acetyltransferase
MVSYCRLRRDALWEVPDLDNPYTRGVLEQRLTNMWGYEEGGRLVSVITLHPMRMYLAGTNTNMAGLAGVVTALAARRRGFVRTLLQHGLSHLHEQNQAAKVRQNPRLGVGWCLDYPFDPRYYARYGFQSLPNGTEVRVPPERLNAGLTSHLRPQQVDPLGDLKKYQPLYADIHQHFIKHYAFALCRDDDMFVNWRRVAAEAFAFVFGKEAYCFAEMIREDGKKVFTVQDYGYKTPAGRSALLTFLADLQGHIDVVDIHLPADDPLLFDLGAFVSGPDTPFQARIVDVAIALASLPAPKQLEHLHVNIIDDFCAWNHGTFSIVMNPSGIVVNRSDKTAEVSVDIRALPLLLTGVSSPRQLAHSGLLAGELGLLEPLHGLAQGVPFMPSSDYF